MSKTEAKKHIKRRTAKKTTKSKVTVRQELTPLEKRFVDIYFSMKTPNLGEAYEMVGYKCTGETARVEANRTFKRPLVKAYYDSLRQEATVLAVKEASDIIAELEKLAFSNIADYVKFNKKGVELKDSSKLTREQMAAVSEVTQVSTKYGERKAFRLYNKPECLELLGKRHGLFPNRQEHTGKEGEAIEHKVNVIHFDRKKQK